MSIRDDDSPISKNFKEVLKGLKMRSSGKNVILRSFHAINKQLENIHKDINAKRNPQGEGIKGTVSTISDLQDKLRKQRTDFSSITEHIDSALEALTQEDEDGLYEEDVNQLKNLNNQEEDECMDNIRLINTNIEETYSKLRTYEERVRLGTEGVSFPRFIREDSGHRSHSASRGTSPNIHKHHFLKPNPLCLDKMKFVDWCKHLNALEHWVGFGMPNGEFIDDSLWIRCLYTTLGDKLREKVDDFRGVKTKKEAIRVMEEILLQHFPLHIRRISALNKKKKDQEDVSVYMKRLAIMYQEARMEDITENILLLHNILQELPKVDAQRKIMENISSHLSSLKIEQDADHPKGLQGVTKVEAERRSKGASDNREERIKPSKKNP